MLFASTHSITAYSAFLSFFCLPSSRGLMTSRATWRRIQLHYLFLYHLRVFGGGVLQMKLKAVGVEQNEDMTPRKRRRKGADRRTLRWGLGMDLE